ncbi:hypothetical protein SOVF_004150 [Spinacia oleracea]|nr:BOI-related E3 ubiquitin-protein ligase 1-like isoform X2 [Spinacia oleracea]KNA25753.1 hypothetical protein SOVF_004150 [Spinacia oleracea]
MFGGGDTNPMLPVHMDGVRLPYNSGIVPSMQLDALFGCNADVMNMVEGRNTSLANLPEKFGRGTSIYSQHKLPVTSYDNFCQNGAGQARNMVKQGRVSTGLKLSYGEEEHNSSISSAGENVMVNLSSMLSRNDNLQTEFARQGDEFDQYIRIQEENIKKGIAELKHRHTVSLLNALEKEVSHKIHEKDIEIETLNQRNKELMEKIRQIALEAQSWHLRAKQNESLVNILKNNINQVVLQGGNTLLKEGCDESIADDAASSCNQNVPESSSCKEMVHCKACKSKEVSVLLLPCRHLCLCTDCDGFLDICPVCRVKKAGSLLVYMS